MVGSKNKGRKRVHKDLDEIHDDMKPNKAAKLLNQEVGPVVVSFTFVTINTITLRVDIYCTIVCNGGKRLFRVYYVESNFFLIALFSWISICLETDNSIVYSARGILIRIKHLASIKRLGLVFSFLFRIFIIIIECGVLRVLSVYFSISDVFYFIILNISFHYLSFSAAQTTIETTFGGAVYTEGSRCSCGMWCIQAC